MICDMKEKEVIHHTLGIFRLKYICFTCFSPSRMFQNTKKKMLVAEKLDEYHRKWQHHKSRSICFVVLTTYLTVWFPLVSWYRGVWAVCGALSRLCGSVPPQLRVVPAQQYRDYSAPCVQQRFLHRLLPPWSAESHAQPRSSRRQESQLGCSLYTVCVCVCVCERQRECVNELWDLVGI